MIPLSFIDKETNLAGAWIYITDLLPSSPNLTVDLGKSPGGELFNLEVAGNVLKANGVGLPVVNICNTTAWVDKGKYIRAFELPNDLETPSNLDRGKAYYLTNVMIKTSVGDMPVPDILNPLGVKYNLEVESRLIDVRKGDDLTNKVIVFDRSTTFSGVNISLNLTIGNPVPQDTVSLTPNWGIKFLFENSLNSVSSWVRDTITELYVPDLWKFNHVDLSPRNGNERFIVTQTVDSGLISEASTGVLNSGYVCSKKHVSTSMNALEIVSNAANRLHMPKPTTLVVESGTYENTSDAQNAVLLLAALNQTVRNISITALWSQLLRELTFNASQVPDNGYNDDIGGFDLDVIAPSFDGIASGYLYVPSLRYRVIHVTDEDFYAMQGASSAQGQYGYRIIGNHLCFTSEIAANVKLLYKTKLAVKSLMGEEKELVTQDGDVCLFDSEAMILGTIMFFKTSIGQDATIEGNLYGAYVKHLQSKMGAPGVIVSPVDSGMTRGQFSY